MCEEASRLLGLYTAALSEFHNVQAPLLRGLSPNSQEFAETMQAKDAAQAVLLQARRLYWDHVSSHGCRERPVQLEESPGPRTQDADSLWRHLVDAKHGLDDSFDAVHEANEELRLGALPASDGHYAYKQALRAQDQALNLYRAALGDLKASMLAGQITGQDQNKPEERRGGSDSRKTGVLTPREVEVLTHIASGKSSRQIADLLGIAFKTVVVHRHHIQTKLKLHNTADLTRTALRMGLIEP